MCITLNSVSCNSLTQNIISTEESSGLMVLRIIIQRLRLIEHIAINVTLISNSLPPDNEEVQWDHSSVEG